jgi:hypothetical protein
MKTFIPTLILRNIYTPLQKNREIPYMEKRGSPWNSVKLLILEFKIIPQNLMPIPMEVNQYESTLPSKFCSSRIPWTP